MILHFHFNVQTLKNILTTKNKIKNKKFSKSEISPKIKIVSNVNISKKYRNVENEIKKC